MPKQEFTADASSLPQAPMRLDTPAHFRFAWCEDFRRIMRTGNKDNGFIVDLEKTTAIDTAALGMLLQLEEYIGSDPKLLQIVNGHPELREVMEIAGLAPYLR